MHQKYDNINVYNNSSVVYMRKQNSKIISWINILLIGSVLFCIIGLKYKYSIFNIYYAKVIKNENENYVYMNVDSEFIDFKNRNYLEIDDKEYKCHLRSISDNYYIFNGKKYWDVTFNCDLPNELNVNDNLIEIKMERRKTTLLKEIFNKIRKGMKNARVKN